MPDERRVADKGLTGGIAFAALLFTLVWAPVPLGSNREWSVSLLAIVVWLTVCGALWSHRSTLSKGHWPLAAQASLPGLALALGLSLWVAIQLALNAYRPDLWTTANPHATQHYLLRTLVYAGGMMLCVLTVRSRNQVLWVLGALLAGGLLQALVSVGLFAGGKSFIYWFDIIDPRSRPSGTFINPDHLAGYLEITLSAGVGLMLALMSPGQRARTWAERLVSFFRFVMSPKMLVRLALVLLVIALVLTRSRMGNGAFFIGIVLVGAVVAWRSSQWRRPALWLVASMLVVDLVIIGQWVGLDAVVNRMKGTAEASSTTLATFGLAGTAPPPAEESIWERLTVPMTALPLIEQRPWIGWGGGGFALAYPAVKPNTVFAGFWDHAHNDFVQIAVDVGLVGLLLWCSIGVFSLWRLWPLLGDKPDRIDRGVAVAALMALCCIGLHSMVDFNMHIPANALSLSVLLALLWMLPGLPARSRRGQRGRERSAGNNKFRDDD